MEEQNWTGLPGVAHPRTLHNILQSMRPKQWTKNAFVLPALIYSGNLLNPVKFGVSLSAIALFCLLSSSVYLVNDILDREKDRHHPKKRNRPIAAGRLSVRLAGTVAGALTVVALGWAYYLGPWVGLISLAYWLQSMLYSIWLKQIVLVDVFIIAIGFALRVLVGGAALRVPLSPWLLITTILLALFLALSKRRHEVAFLENAEAHRGVLAEYSVPLLDQLTGIVTAGLVVVYSLYTFLVSKEGHLIYTVPFVLFGTFRYLYLTHRRDVGGEPESIVLRDVPLIVDVLLWAGTTVIILYMWNP